MNEDEAAVRVGSGYPLAQLARALVTAAEHEDLRVRELAEQRVRRWQQVLDGMAVGEIAVGSRAPLKNLPAWATPEVVRGGFATGQPTASGPLRPHETDLVLNQHLPARRKALVASYLTEAGLARLNAMLDDGRYQVR